MKRQLEMLIHIGKAKMHQNVKERSSEKSINMKKIDIIKKVD